MIGKAERRMPLGVVLERRESESRWVDYTYQPIAVVPGASPLDPTGDDWKQVADGPGWVQFHAGTLDLELFKDETQGYKTNLSNFKPHIYVVLTPGEEADEPDLYPMLVTACPYAAESYTEDSEVLVEGVPMPPEIVGWLQAFCEAFHKEQPFYKRKRKPYDPRKQGFRQSPGAAADSRHRGRKN